MDLKDVHVKTVKAFTTPYYDVRIREGDERLVKVESHHGYSWYHHEMKLAPTPDIFLRETVYGMFLAARDTLQEQGFDLKVYDGWRSVELQEALFWYYMQRFTIDALGYTEHFANCKSGKEVKAAFSRLPELDQARLNHENRKYVSWPSKDRKRPSPHATGGAIDVWLYRDDEPVTLGVPFDYMKEPAAAFYHLKHPNTSWPEGRNAEVRRHRELLLRAMVGAGFQCYPHEIWHFNYGNQMAAHVTNEVARYGYIEP